ncbi:OmpA family protein [Janibacter sp. G56]|uniref:OmpA family protein n=1 Tax=Janibacter sp. G56 TaxID=3418717 RepID=UPI003D04E135
MTNENQQGAPVTRRHRRSALGALGAVALAGALGLGAAPAQAEDEVPILGQAPGISDRATDKADQKSLLTLHGVRRVEGGTVVYYSLGWLPGSRAGDAADLTHTLNAGGLNLGRGARTGETDDVAVIDQAGAKAYVPLVKDTECLCSDFIQALTTAPKVGTMYVLHAVLPPLPESLTEASVLVGGRIFTDVPIEDGALTPEVDTSADDAPPVVVGTGWPKVDPATIASATDVEKSVLPLTEHRTLLKAAVSTRKQGTKSSIDIAADVLFDVDQATLTAKAKKEIAAAATEYTRSGGGSALTITGHTDADGADAHNQDLSERRAEAVAKAIRPLLPKGTRITTAGKGETDPIASNETTSGKALNRRVTLTGGTK